MIHHIKPYFYRRFKTSFSKSGEDIQLWQLLKKAKGTYVDIGGHHPIFANNSYFFYLRGWNGIVIEPNPIFVPLYQKYRSIDILFKGGIARAEGEMDYFEFEGNERNSFSVEHLQNFDLVDRVKSKSRLPVKRLADVCQQYLEKPTSIDFMSLDVEGMELEVLESNDWQNFRPKYILIESHQSLLDEIEGEVYNYLIKHDYDLVGKSLQGHFLGTIWFRANEVRF